MNNKVFEFLNRPSTKLERNGFDRSFRSVFSVKAGLALPALCIENVPRGYYELNPVDFLRTEGMNESNFVRMKQHLDFFFVPYSMIWRYWEQFYQQTADPVSSTQTSAVIPEIGVANGNLRVPTMPLVPLVCALMKASATQKQQVSSFNSLIAASGISFSQSEEAVVDMFLDSSDSQGIKRDIQGYPMYQGVVRILDMLNYGNYLPFIKMNYGSVNSAAQSPDELTYKTNFFRWLNAYRDKKINIWRLAAYQAVCEFYYTNTHYVKPNVSAYNFDDVVMGNVHTSRSNAGVDLFTPHYVPWKFDYFTSALPSPQFGAVSLVSNYVGIPNASSTSTLSVAGSGSNKGDVFKTGSGPTAERLISNLDVMDLKRAEALQAWKIAIGRAGYTTDARFEATFGSTPKFSPQMRPVRLGSIDADILKDPVTGTSGDEFAQMASTGSSSLNSRKITFASEDFGVIIGIFRVLPVAEYDSYSIDAVNTKVDPFDYFTPKFQDLGLQVLPAHELSIFGTGLTGVDTAVGYVPRYSEYKVSVDRVHGEYCQQPILFPPDGAGDNYSQEPVGEFQHFVSTRMDLETWQGDLKQFFVDPAVLNHIFLQQADKDMESQSSDQFHVNLYCQLNCVQPMSVLGLPQFNN